MKILAFWAILWYTEAVKNKTNFGTSNTEMVTISRAEYEKLQADHAYISELEQQVRDLGLGDRVKFLGFLTGQPLTERLNACRAVVLPSEWYENGPYSVMEALAVGKPVLGSRIGGIPEMVQEGQTGFLFRPGDAEDLAAAIGRLYGLTEEGYQALCRSAAAFAAETFSEEAYLAQLLPIYERLTGKQ